MSIRFVAAVAAAVFVVVHIADGDSIVRTQIREIRHEILSYPVYRPMQLDHFLLAGAEPKNPTAMAFGPDDRLYVTERTGMILAYSLDRSESGYEVVATERITVVHEMPNRDDLGRVQPAIEGRLVTGIVAAGTREAPILYVSSSDPRILDAEIDTNSGIVSRVERRNSVWHRTDLVRGLPRSRVDHATHGLALDVEHDRLYVAQGGNTNTGAPSTFFHGLAEYALAGAILEIDLSALGPLPHDLPTLDDEDRDGEEDENDPFGGNDGKNQAVSSPGAPVRLYATGLRNPYDLVLTSRGIYTIDNGANQGFGGKPVFDDARGVVTNELNDRGRYVPNSLHHVAERGYYGGHPNPTRANRENRFNASNPQSPVVAGDPREAEFIAPRRAPGVIAVFAQSTNGLTRYEGAGRRPSRRDVLLAVGRDRSIHRLELSADGSRVLDHREMVKNLGHFPLDILTRRPQELYAGTIWVCDYAGDAIHVIEPQRHKPVTVRQRLRDSFEWSRMKLAELAAYR